MDQIARKGNSIHINSSSNTLPNKKGKKKKKKKKKMKIMTETSVLVCLKIFQN